MGKGKRGLEWFSSLKLSLWRSGWWGAGEELVGVGGKLGRRGGGQRYYFRSFFCCLLGKEYVIGVGFFRG